MMVIHSGDIFWVVWRMGGGSPTVRHQFFDQANKEAMRLARENPGHTFVVLAADRSYRVPPPEVQPLEQINFMMRDTHDAIVREEELPF